MRAITSDDMKGLEAYASSLGIPSRILMEVAGMKAANIAMQEIKKAGNICVICGCGGNGGDGFVAARYFRIAGIPTEVFLSSPEISISNADSIENLKILKNMKVKITEISNNGGLNELVRSMSASDIVVDAIFGIGMHGEIKGIEANVIELINSTKKGIIDKRPYAVVSLDVPSGADATTGEVSSKCVEADLTVTFELPKIGLFKYPASKFAGRIITASIGIPEKEMAKQRSSGPSGRSARTSVEGLQVTDPGFVAGILPRRKADANKGDFGKVLVIAGSSGMMGAAVLTARAALRSGSGLVTLCVPDKIKDIVNSMSDEIVVAGFSEIRSKLKDCDVVAIGPGLSRGNDLSKLVNDIIKDKGVNVPLVIDADGLNAISDPAVFKLSGKDIVITPHPGEFARLSGQNIADVQIDRIGNATRFSSEYGVITVLKGANTIIAGRGGAYINPTGNPAMASAGVGDVLTGIIASLIGQGISTFNSAVAGVFIHGMAGNLSSSLRGERGVIAGDIVDSIPYTLASIT